MEEGFREGTEPLPYGRERVAVTAGASPRPTMGARCGRVRMRAFAPMGVGFASRRVGIWRKAFGRGQSPSPTVESALRSRADEGIRPYGCWICFAEGWDMEEGFREGTEPLPYGRERVALAAGASPRPTTERKGSVCFAFVGLPRRGRVRPLLAMTGNGRVTGDRWSPLR